MIPRRHYEQFSKAQGAREGEGELEMVARRASEDGETIGYAGAGFGGASAPGGGYPTYPQGWVWIRVLKEVVMSIWAMIVKGF
jgi:hypothetical protein